NGKRNPGTTQVVEARPRKMLNPRRIGMPRVFADQRLLVISIVLLAAGIAQDAGTLPKPNSLAFPGEKRLRNIRQLTFGGQNAEAYFSADDRNLIFQHQGGDVPCDQIYTIPVETPDGKPAQPKLLSTGKGRTTCSYFFP